tara:strand:- start:863 stop:1627 length:765 start_codon:yes stop_codon:yes gene_type:complete
MYKLTYILKELDNYKLPDLKKKGKNLNINKWYKLRKATLLNTIKQELAAKKIQKNFRNKKGIHSDLCPISLKPVTYPCWMFKTNTKCVYYNLIDLVQYLTVSGNFRDPMTRVNYSIKDLNSMDRTMINLKIKHKSLVSLKKNPDFYRRKKMREETINTISDQIREIISLMRDKIEDIPRTTQLDMELNLNCVFYPNLKTLFRNLSNRSRRKCKESFEDSIELIDTTRKLNDFSTIFVKQIKTFLKREKRKYFVK